MNPLRGQVLEFLSPPIGALSEETGSLSQRSGVRFHPFRDPGIKFQRVSFLKKILKTAQTE